MRRYAFVLLSIFGAACAGRAPTSEPGEPAATSVVSPCRAACFACRRMSCGEVEAQCGRNHGRVRVGGVSLPCRDAERIACHVGTVALDGDPTAIRCVDPVATCLQDCGGPRTSGEDEEPGPLRERTFTSAEPAEWSPNLSGVWPSAFP